MDPKQSFKPSRQVGHDGKSRETHLILLQEKEQPPNLRKLHPNPWLPQSLQGEGAYEQVYRVSTTFYKLEFIVVAAISV